MSFDFSIFVTYWPLIVHGLFLTITASALGLVLSLMFATLVVLARLARATVSQRLEPIRALRFARP